jgi:hypothetical protein
VNERGDEREDERGERREGRKQMEWEGDGEEVRQLYSQV